MRVCGGGCWVLAFKISNAHTNVWYTTVCLLLPVLNWNKLNRRQVNNNKNCAAVMSFNNYCQM